MGEVAVGGVTVGRVTEPEPVHLPLGPTRNSQSIAKPFARSPVAHRDALPGQIVGRSIGTGPTTHSGAH